MTDQEIQALIGLPKAIINRNPARGYREQNGQRRCDLELQPADGTRPEFQAFIRQNLRLPGNFSIGLRCGVYEGKLTTITLARYNGPHGENSRAADGHYALPHIHYITEGELASGHTQPRENYRELTTRYTTFEEAMRVFFQDTATRNYAQFFPELLEPRML